VISNKNKELPITTTYPSVESLHAVDNPKPEVAYAEKMIEFT